MRFVFPPEHAKHGQCVIHFVGWNIKWNEEIAVASDRLAKRHTHTSGPHRSRSSCGRMDIDNPLQHRNSLVQHSIAVEISERYATTY